MTMDNNNFENDEILVFPDNVSDDTVELIEDNVADETINGADETNADLTAFSGQNPVRKISMYGLTSTSKEITKVYKALFNSKDKNPEQIVYFGAPGTGKSYNIDKRLHSMLVQSQYIYRVIFHPDYSYGDFIGSIKPKKDINGIDYRFQPGPLTNALINAFENPYKEVYVVIEEINRGNAAAIFGDLFQLLDRDKSGRSKYKITNANICSVICRNPKFKPFFKSDHIWFPNNLNFLCTMNTADQNVFILDSAFKRRFHMEYLKIDFDKIYNDNKLKDYLNETTVFAGNKSLEDVFRDTELEDYVSVLKVEGKLKRNWATFALLVNRTIDNINRNEGDRISEDKKLGPFYVLLDELAEKKMFADKVIYYLKQDVFKYIDNYFIDSYQRIYEDFVSNSTDIFEMLLPGEI